MTSLLFALISAISTAALECAYRFLMRRSLDPWTVAIVTTLGAGAILAAVFGAGDWSTVRGADWPLLLTSCGLWSILLFSDLKSYQFLDASLNAMLNLSRFVMLNLAGVLLFGETLTFTNILGLSLVCVSIPWGVRLHRIAPSPGVRYRLASVVSGTLAVIIEKDLSTRLDVQVIINAGFILPGLFLLALQLRRLPQLIGETKRATRSLTLVTLTYALAGFTFVNAFAAGPIGLTVTVIQLKVVFVFLIAVSLLNERTDMRRRGVASLLCLIGVLFATMDF